jgi:hypothetical protein
MLGDTHSATVIVNVAEAVSPAAGVTLEGVILHVMPGGDSVANVTAELNPLIDWI